MKIKEVIVVEGKSDTAMLKSILDVDTIETGGLCLSKQTMDLIKEAHDTRGIILFTDPDFPGNKIRQMILDELPDCKQAYVAKKDAIKRNKVGIAETDPKVILEALENVTTYTKDQESITWQEFLSLDIIGNKKRRLKVYNAFHLGYGNVKTLFKRLNMVGITKEQIEEVLYGK